MKKLYLIARNHMDPSWLRCFTESFEHPQTGETVRPYADIEEMQILEYMDFAEKYGVRYQIEQSLVVKKFLERNPDQYDRFRSLVRKGLLELAGGGEAVIDCNLTQGESWARNHLYSRRYYEKEFGIRPKYAITPDIFGLASQLPQFFRSIGYDALIIFDRVFKNNKPYWRGLDGTLLVMDSCFLQPPEPNLRTADCVKLPACGACSGKGCALCSGTGVDVTYDMTRPDKELLQSAYYGNMSADVFLETLLKTDKEEYFVMITTEEPRIGDFLYGPLKEAASRHGIDVRYLGFEENHEVWCGGYEAPMRAGAVTEDQIDERIEGNPAGCGCYSSRIEIKKANFELEQLLSEAESLAAAVRYRGGWTNEMLPRRDYPSKKLEALWNKMAFIQFHDCITGTHCDAGYEELMRYIREVRRGAYQIYSDAALEWCKINGVTVPDGYYAVVYFNPTSLPEPLPRISLYAPKGTKAIRLFGLNGMPIPAFDFERTKALVGDGFVFRAKADVPPFGWRVFLWKPDDTAEKPTVQKDSIIENEYFRITASKNGIKEIFDKKLNRATVVPEGCCLAVGDDIGHAWGRTQPEKGHRKLYADSVRTSDADGAAKMILAGTLCDTDRGIDCLKWEETIVLYPGDPLVRFHTELDWHGRNTRVFADFNPAFICDGKLWCEVPFGTMERPMPEQTDLLGLTDEWPSLGFAGVTDGATNIAVFKGGFPGTRIHNGSLQISLLRAFTMNDPKYAGTSDCGKHVADYALKSWSGSFTDGCPAAMAASFLRKGHTQPVSGPGIWIDEELAPKNTSAETGTLLPFMTQIPPQLRVSALKWAEDGSGLVIRLWETAGSSVRFTLPGKRLLRCNTLEEPAADTPSEEYVFRPFEIATFRISD